MEEILCMENVKILDFVVIRIIIVNILGYIERCMLIIFGGS